MKHDSERIRRIRESLHQMQLDAFVCALPTNVLLLSGYWPVVGLSVAIADKGGRVVLIVPQDERSLASKGWANEVFTFSGSVLDEESSAIHKLEQEVRNVLAGYRAFRGGIGYETKAEYQTSTYAAMHLPGIALHRFLQRHFPDARLASADSDLAALRSTLTPAEIARVRIACRIAEKAFHRGVNKLRAGLTETEAANRFRSGLTSLPRNVERADGFVYCMSGENSFEAFASFQRSRSRKIRSGDLVLIHCNSYADGFWTDITRTFCIGEPDHTKRQMFEAMLAARESAITAARPGVRAADVDKAARDVLANAGFGEAFRHPTGHGVGYAAINHNAPPRLHTGSQDVLAPGMVFNIEPGIYIEGVGGMRHCDMVAVTHSGVEVLTPFQSALDELVIDVRNVQPSVS